MDFLRMSKSCRKATNRVMEMMDEGLLDPRAVADACLCAMSEDDVALMAHNNELFQQEEDDETEEDADEE
jgi:hypothetical protein